MSDVASAGTLVSAVMETAGYVSQSHLLEWFQGFWRSAGALIYLGGIVGAIISVAVLGSYRWARYLIIAPTLYWFLIFERTEIEPALWKVGGGAEKKVDRVFDGDIDRVKPTENVRVSWFYAKFVKLISGITNSAVDVILKYEDNQALISQMRHQMTQLFINAVPAEDPEIYEMLNQSLFGECQRWTNAAFDLSSSTKSEAFDQELNQLIVDGKLNSIGAAQRREALRQEVQYKEEHLRMLSDQRITPGGAMMNFVFDKASAGTKHPILEKTYQEILDFDTVNFTTLDEQVTNLRVSCQQAWLINLHSILDNAAKFVSKSMQENLSKVVSSGANDPGAMRRVLCRSIADKMHPDIKREEIVKADNCDLVQTVGAYMLRNIVLNQEASKRIFSAKKNLKFPGSLRKRFSIVDLNQSNKGLMETADNSVVFYDQNAGLYLAKDRQKEASLIAQGVPENLAKQQSWVPYGEVNIEGPLSNVFGVQQHFAMRALIRQVYVRAMSMPYYQGLVLYFISVAYPFLALIVLVPSKAVNFLYVPLVWLWAKSWDVGYACVVVLEKVLWYLLPHTEVKYQVFSTAENHAGVNIGFDDPTLFPHVMRAALSSADPTYDIHAHIMFLSVTMFSIPTITGYAILRGKSSILSSFLKESDQEARDAGSRSSDAYGLVKSNEFVQRFELLSDMAVSSHRNLGQQYKVFKQNGYHNQGQRGGTFGQGRHEQASAAKDYVGGQRSQGAFIESTTDAILGVARSAAAPGSGSKKRGGMRKAFPNPQIKSPDKRAQAVNDARADLRSDAIQGIFNAAEGWVGSQRKGEEKGYQTYKKIAEVEQELAAAHSKIFHNDLGMMGATARYHRARSGAMDRGGFELEMIEHAGNYVNKYLAAYKTKFNLAIDAELDVELAWMSAGSEFVGTGVGVLGDYTTRGIRTGDNRNRPKEQRRADLQKYLIDHTLKKGAENIFHIGIGVGVSELAKRPGLQGRADAADSANSIVDEFVHPYHRRIAEEHIRVNRADEGPGFSPWFPVNLEQRKEK